MTGPSSSHTAGAVRLGLLVRKIYKTTPKKVTFVLYNSFAKTGKGHGTDKGLLAGLLGYGVDSEFIKNIFNTKEAQEIQYSYIFENNIDRHPNAVDFISRNWEINQTVTVKGRIRVTSTEEKSSGNDASWGEDIPETTTRFVRELIITKGDDEGKEEEFAYNPADIKNAFNVRKANIEQLQIDAKNGGKKAAAPAKSTSNKYSWEE